MPVKSSGQRGIEAIFSSPKRRRRDFLFIGASGIVTGLTLITLSKLGAQPAFSSMISGVLLSGSLILASLGLLFLTGGAGVCMVELVEHALAKRRAKLWQFGTELSVLDQIGEQTKKSSLEERRLNFRLSLVVFLQGCLLVTLFAGLVEEYGSNLTMQEWVNSSFSFGQVLLTWQAVLAISFLMGLLVVYCLLGRDLVL